MFFHPIFCCYFQWILSFSFPFYIQFNSIYVNITVLNKETVSWDFRPFYIKKTLPRPLLNRQKRIYEIFSFREDIGEKRLCGQYNDFADNDGYFWWFILIHFKWTQTTTVIFGGSFSFTLNEQSSEKAVGCVYSNSNILKIWNLGVTRLCVSA